MDKLALLDLNGTIIASYRCDGLVITPSGWQWIEGAAEGLRLLADNGWLFAVVTNQPAEHRVENLSHQRMVYTLRSIRRALEESTCSDMPFFVCYHDAEHGCQCRKPRIGLLREAGYALGIRPRKRLTKYGPHVWMIGDSPSDVYAGKNFETQTCLVVADPRGVLPEAVGADIVVPNLMVAAEQIIKRLPRLR